MSGKWENSAHLGSSAGQKHLHEKWEFLLIWVLLVTNIPRENGEFLLI